MNQEINPHALYWASFDRFELRLPGECVTNCSASGSVDDAVEHWTPFIRAQVEKDNFPNQPTADSIRAELKEYGAWDSNELADDDANWGRLVWIAACNINESEQADCSEPLKGGAL